MGRNSSVSESRRGDPLRTAVGLGSFFMVALGVGVGIAIKAASGNTGAAIGWGTIIVLLPPFVLLLVALVSLFIKAARRERDVRATANEKRR
jgi:hypothetical protein